MVPIKDINLSGQVYNILVALTKRKVLCGSC
jgi:hypothetical protein